MYRDSQQQSDNVSGHMNRISAPALRTREIFQSFQFLVVFANESLLGRMAPMGTQARGPHPERCGQNYVVHPADTPMTVLYRGRFSPATGAGQGHGRYMYQLPATHCLGGPEARAPRKPRRLESSAAGAACLSGSLCCFITPSSQGTRR